MAEYRELPADEWARISWVFTQYGAFLPNPATSKIFVAEDDGKVVALLVRQFVPHLEPLWIDPDYRGRLLFTRLITMAENDLKLMGQGDYYAFIPSEKVEKIARFAGLEPLPYAVWKKSIEQSIARTA